MRATGFWICVFVLSLALPSLAQQGRFRTDTSPQAGQPAPDFELSRVEAHGKATGQTIQLSSFKGKRPVVLVFGSYT